MNSSNQTNDTSLFYPAEYWYAFFGSTPLLNALFYYLLTPISILGVFLNLLSFYILCKSKFPNLALYSFLRVYVIESFILNFFLSLFFIPNSYGTISFANSYPSAFYMAYIYTPFLNVFVLFGSFLDICISLDRIFMFYPKLDIFSKFSHYKICLFLLVLSLVICSQYFFNSYPTYMDVNLNSTQVLRLYNWESTSFSQSLLAQALNYTNYVLRDIVLLIVEIVLNVMSILFLKKHLAKKTNVLETKRHSKPAEISESLNKAHALNTNVNKAEQNATKMVVFICTLSVLEHLFFITMAVYFNYIRDDAVYMVATLCNLWIIIKHFSNFYLLYFYNKIFKKEVNQLFRCC